ncbi:ATP-binding protein [Sedimentibacter sp. MB31-C6]|uniref:ATP-binding protein n=1 Tax=Sedimentibacter sp. MB31-C6 TaxID=3109366 RepID=UPI002DDD8DFE|nr:ATP-binding protein [Sedimentibacter sp. MB36-C1]WSI03408.1 ATP-binding protein [Sedimentibacter sp. MB36-C1]
MKQFQKMFIIGLIVTITSQIYFNFIIDGFRVSTSVIIFPILLLTYNDLNVMHASAITAIMVFIIRLFILVIRDVEIVQALYSVYPGSLFYLIYGFIFKLLKIFPYYHFSKMFLLILTCDFIANVFEVFIRMNLTYNIDKIPYLFVLFMIATTRATMALIILILIRNYKILLTKEDHEKRYQNLILINSSLISEIYLMRKNTDDVENIMSNSYKLYEKLSISDNSDEIINLSLNITKDIHEIKKDYLRVIKGIESNLVNKIELTEMSIKDIFYILKDSTYTMLEGKYMSVLLDFRYEENFTTKNHFQLMSIMRNLVNNAIESFDPYKSNNFVRIRHKKENENHILIIEDNGKGITEENINYIFNPGFSTKFDYYTGDVYRGIGLTHVKTLVNDYFNGDIRVSSRQKIGTKFEIKIPVINMED